MSSESTSKVINVHEISFAHEIYAKLKSPEHADFAESRFSFYPLCYRLFHLKRFLSGGAHVNALCLMDTQPFAVSLLTLVRL